MIIKNTLKNIFLKIYLYKFWFILTLEIYAFIVIFSYVSSSWQVVNDVNSLSFKKSNVIVLLGAGVIKDKHGNFIPSFYAYSRINKVASIYNMCKNSKKKCVIIISGGNKNKKYLTEAYIYFVNLVNIGVPYKDIIATQIDPTSGVYEGYIYEKGLVGETLKATQPDLVALGSSVVGFISSINNGIGILLDYEAYELRADADGSTADSKLASDCGLSAMLQILI
jgi:hypothetical protein